jgi:hypothetical protein
MTISELNVSDNTKIKITKDTVNDKTFGQIRLWTKTKDNDDFIPTRKGIAFDLKLTGDIIQGLLTLEDMKGEA